MSLLASPIQDLGLRDNDRDGLGEVMKSEVRWKNQKNIEFKE
jgi:hypothetical protein